MTAAGSVVCDKRLWAPENQLLALSSKPASLRDGVGESARSSANYLPRLPLRLATGQFLDLGLLRSAGVVAGLERLFRFAFLAGSTFGFLAFFFG